MGAKERIQARQAEREKKPLDQRQVEALETIADMLEMIRSELTSIVSRMR